MNTALAAILDRNRKFLPLAATIGMFLLVYLFGFLSYPAMRDGQALFNLFDAAPFLIVIVVGEGLVIISGGIDLSVSGILALTTVVAASLLQMGWSAWAIFPVVLVMGMLFGLVMGLFITYLKVQPFIATLAGMWLARGLSYVVSDAEVRIHDATYTTLGQTKILIPGLADPSSKHGDYITYLVVVALVVLVVGLFLAHFTRFGRTIYAMGGGNGLNEQSARLMGLPVNRTKVLVYALSGFCSALGGILYSIYVNSGRGNAGTGLELTAIAAVVIGGIALTGGEGYLVGALVGVLITSLIQSIIQADGTISNYWVYIVIGLLMLVGIVVKNGILLVDYTNQLRRRGLSRTDAILRAGPTRLRPILMTSSAAVLGMFPLALALARGSETEAPLATAVIGGLITSTMLTLLVVPVVYTLFDDLSAHLIRRRKPVAVPEPAPEPEPTGVMNGE